MKLLQIRFVGRAVLYLSICSVLDFYAIHYKDTVEQTMCTFSRSIRANDLGKLRSAQCMGRRESVITLALIKRENVHVVCSTVSP